MSKGSRRKRATRPWQDPRAMRDLTGLEGLPAGHDDDLELEGYEVRRIDPDRAEKEYLCPDCGNPIARGEGHVVVWPVGDSELRRHWHRHGWRVEVRRSAGGAA